MPLKSRTQFAVAAFLAYLSCCSAQGSTPPNPAKPPEININPTPLPYASALPSINQWTEKVTSEIPGFDYTIKIQPCDPSQPPIVYNGKHDSSMHLTTDQP